MIKAEQNIIKLFNYLSQSQWDHQTNFESINKLPITTREDLRKTEMKKGFYACTTSGSTGETLTVQKTYLDLVWYYATS